jgi:hypothetical protein
VLAGRRHLANEKWCGTPRCAVLPARATWRRGSTDAWAGYSAVLGKGREIALRCGLEGGHTTTAKFGPNQRRSRCAEFARVLAACAEFARVLAANFRDT